MRPSRPRPRFPLRSAAARCGSRRGSIGTEYDHDSGLVAGVEFLQLLFARLKLQRLTLVVGITKDDRVSWALRQANLLAVLVDELFILIGGLHAPLVEPFVPSPG